MYTNADVEIIEKASKATGILERMSTILAGVDSPDVRQELTESVNSLNGLNNDIVGIVKNTRANESI